MVTLTCKIASTTTVYSSSRVKERWKWMQGDHGTSVLLIDCVVTGTVYAGAITKTCLVWHISVCPRNASIHSTHNNKWGLCRANWETSKGLASAGRVHAARTWPLKGWGWIYPPCTQSIGFCANQLIIMSSQLAVQHYIYTHVRSRCAVLLG